jgi:hypothetical protein
LYRFRSIAALAIYLSGGENNAWRNFPQPPTVEAPSEFDRCYDDDALDKIHGTLTVTTLSPPILFYTGLIIKFLSRYVFSVISRHNNINSEMLKNKS